ncbi:MAG TPA: hypothetical protein VIL34_16425 [Actinopolymorphaceae bacterium]
MPAEARPKTTSKWGDVAGRAMATLQRKRLHATPERRVVLAIGEIER